MTQTPQQIRAQIWQSLTPVALPDSRFHLDFAEFIPDFAGSAEATSLLMAEQICKDATYIFVTPDNGLVELRRQLLEAGKTLVVTTYGLRRGFILLEPHRIPKGCALYAAWLDGLEHFGQPISLRDLQARGRFDLLVTGASAVSRNGVRFGKGHGYFDMEWGMFTDLHLADEATPIAALVHHVQLVQTDLVAGPTDILVDMIVTPTQILRVLPRGKRPTGIKWDLLTEHMIEAAPPLQELWEIKRAGQQRNFPA